MGSRDENPEPWDLLSSQTYLDRIDAPVLLFHGSNDGDVPKAWSDDLAHRLQDIGKDVTYVVYEGEKHEFIPKWQDFMERTAAFLREHLAME